MKQKALAIILALCMVISMFPATVFAARSPIAGHDLDFVPQPADLKSDLKPIGTEELNAKTYKLTLRTSANGHTAATAYSAAKGEVIYIEADPYDGYLAYFDTNGDELDLVYIGYNLYALTMPGHNVSIDVYYEPAPGDYHEVKVTTRYYAKHALDYIHVEAKQYESIFIMIEPDSFKIKSVRAVSGGEDLPVYYLGQIDGKEAYEFFMPDGDVEIIVDTIRTSQFGFYFVINDTQLSGDVRKYDGEDGVVDLPIRYAVPGEEITFTAYPKTGYKMTQLEIIHTSWQIGENETIIPRHLGGNRYSFIMPDALGYIHADFEPLINPVSVTVETGLGGTASLDVSEAQEGSTVTLTCVPEEGYRVAQITGVSGITDNGDNTYSFTMPGKAVKLYVLFLRHENPFVDVNETHFFYDPVLWAVENGITNGIDATHFGPFQTSNRAAVVTMLWRWAGSPEPATTENPFEDVPAESWYTKPVLWAVENGITTGVSPTQFGPNLVCNRAQVVTFLYRYLKASAPEGMENPFVDVEAGSWYEAPVLWALANGITTGADATHFNPNGECLRAQFVTFLYRASLLPAEYDLHWVINGFQDTPSDYGTVTLSHDRAAAGETITATVVPAEGYQIDWVKCENGSEITQVSDTEYTFVMPEGEEIFHVNFVEIPEPEPTDPEPTDPTDPEPTDPEEPTEPVKTYTLDVRTNVNAEIIYVDGKTAAAPGESIFFYVNPEPGYVLAGVGLFDPYGEIDLSKIQLYAHEDNLYEFVMIDHDIILNFNFDPA